MHSIYTSQTGSIHQLIRQLVFNLDLDNSPRSRTGQRDAGGVNPTLLSYAAASLLQMSLFRPCGRPPLVGSPKSIWIWTVHRSLEQGIVTQEGRLHSVVVCRYLIFTVVILLSLRLVAATGEP